MPGCVAVGCTNSAKKGQLMKQFPKDLKRREQWAIQVNRPNWVPTDHSRLCEVHFESCMWEKIKVDGTRKLKGNALPTLFLVQQSLNNNKTIEPERPVINLGQFSQPQKEDEGTQNVILSELSEKVKRYDKIYLKTLAKSKQYKQKLRKAKALIKKLHLQLNSENNYKMLRYVHNNNQINALQKKILGKSTKFMKWSEDTVIKALRLKFSCGNAGYRELLKQHNPLPSIRTLQRKLQNLKFDSGILNEVFSFMKIKVEPFNDFQRDCCLVIDEMAITPGVTYDTSMNKFFGYVTFPNHNGIATHVLVLMLAGISCRWKQVVGYYFTGNSTNGVELTNVILKVFEEAAKLSLNIISITSDMGASNQAMWKCWGISAGRHGYINSKITHPMKPDEEVYFLADVPHLFKNIKAMFITNQILKIPEDIKKKNNLPTTTVCASHLMELVEFQESLTFKLVPKLTKDDLLPSQFQKMKVVTSTNIINHAVASALYFLAAETNNTAYITTAWFIDQVEKWFYIMTSRHPSHGLSKFNTNKYQESIEFLNNFMDLFSRMEVGDKKIWKPSQTGVLLSTNSILKIQEHLLEKRKYKFLLTSRFSQDCLENIFSILRSKQVVPNAMQVKNNLKLLTVSQYLEGVKNTNYEEDDREFFAGFLNSFNDNCYVYHQINISDKISKATLTLNYSELNSFYNVCGYIVSSVIKTSTTCPNCVNTLGSRKPINKTFSRFTQFKAYTKNTLFFCNELSFYYFLDLETVFKTYINYVKEQQVNLKMFFVNKMKDEKHEINIPKCHNLQNKIITRFVTFRLKIASQKKKTLVNRHSSKSVAGWCL